MNTAVKPIDKIATVQELYNNRHALALLEQASEKHLNAETMMRILSISVRQSPQLQKADPLSMIGALMTCGALGLVPQTPLRHAHLVPFGRTVTPIIGYQGLIQMALRSGQVKQVQFGVHYENDPEWEYRKGTNAVLNHVEGPQQGEPLHAWAMCTLDLGGGMTGQNFVVYPWERIEHIRDTYSQDWKRRVERGTTDQAFWTLHRDTMACKTMVIALANRGLMPMNTGRPEVNYRDVVNEKPMDYRGFALHPESGLNAIEDDTLEEVEEAEEVKEEPKPKPKPRAKAEPKEKPTAKEVEKVKEEPPKPKGIGLLAVARSDLDGCSTLDDIEAMDAMYQEQMPDADQSVKDELNAMIEARAAEIRKGDS